MNKNTDYIVVDSSDDDLEDGEIIHISDEDTDDDTLDRADERDETVSITNDDEQVQSRKRRRISSSTSSSRSSSPIDYSIFFSPERDQQEPVYSSSDDGFSSMTSNQYSEDESVSDSVDSDSVASDSAESDSVDSDSVESDSRTQRVRRRTNKGRALEDVSDTTAAQYTDTGKLICSKLDRRNNEIVYLKPYQIEAVEAIFREPRVFLYFQVGSGKTATALCAAENLLKTNSVKDVFLVAPTAVQTQWMKEAQNWKCHRTLACLKRKGNIKSYYATANDSAFDQPAKFRDSLLILDECHHLRKSGTQKQKKFNDLMASDDCPSKIMMLSGTPCINYPSDMAIFLKTLYPEIYGLDRGIGPQAFNSRFGRDGVTIDQEELQTIVRKRFLYHERPNTGYAPIAFETVPIYMSPAHLAYYTYRIEESGSGGHSTTGEGAETFVETDRFFAAFLLSARLDSNAVNTNTTDLLAWNPRFSRPEVLEEYQPLAVKKLFSENAGFNDVIFYDRMNVLVNKALKDVQEGHQTVIFSEFETRSTDVIAQLLQNRKPQNVHFRILSGKNNRPAYRTKVVEDFNAGKVQILIVSKAFGEGIDLKGCTRLHITQPVWESGIRHQIIGRIQRLNAHAMLPQEKQNILIREYLVMERGGEDNRMFADVWVAKRSSEKDKLIKDFMLRLVQYSQNLIN